MINDRTEFEEAVRSNFKIPAAAFNTKSEQGYYDGHLNAYYQVWRLCEEKKGKKIADFKLKLWDIAENVILRKPNAGAELVAKQLCIDIRAHLDGIS